MKWPWTRPEQKSSGPVIALAQLPQVIWNTPDGASLLRDGYTGNAIAYRCVRMIAEAAASIPLRAGAQMVSDLLAKPSPQSTGRTLLERVYADLQLTGNAWIEAVTLDGEEVPRALYPWPALSARSIRDREGRRVAEALRTPRGERQLGPAQDGWMPVLHLCQYNPGDPANGFSPLAAARKALDLHNAAAGWAKALIDNAARPSGALVYGRDGSRLSDAQFERLKSELQREHMGAANAGRPLLLEGGLDWTPMSLSPADMDFEQTRNTAAREIALALGVPPMLLGIPGDNTYANYREANTAFWRLTVLPLVHRTVDALSVWLSGRFEDARLTPDLEDVPAFADERSALWARVSAAEFIGVAEKRRLLGLGPAAGS